MTEREFHNKLRRAVEKAKVLVQSIAPVRSGFLKMHIELVTTATGYSIVISGVPYMPYTEEPWISPQWGGRANPNEGWFREAAELVFRLLRQELGGTGAFLGNPSTPSESSSENKGG